MVMVDTEESSRDLNTVRKIVRPENPVLAVLKPFSPPTHIRFGNRIAVDVKFVKGAIPIRHECNDSEKRRGREVLKRTVFETET